MMDVFYAIFIIIEEEKNCEHFYYEKKFWPIWNKLQKHDRIFKKHKYAIFIIIEEEKAWVFLTM